jgi:dTDP-4-amino-4,6-dideoxygalactose transaminase
VHLKLEDLKVDRDAVQQAINAQNIGTGIHFVSLHLHPYYRDTYGYKKDDFPNSLCVSERTVSLPLSAKLTDDDVQDVIQAVSKVLDRFSR